MPSNKLETEKSVINEKFNLEDIAESLTTINTKNVAKLLNILPEADGG